MPNKSVEITSLKSGDLFTLDEGNEVWSFIKYDDNDGQSSVAYVRVEKVATKNEHGWDLLNIPERHRWNPYTKVRKVKLAFTDI